MSLAPNVALRIKKDHSALTLSTDELGSESTACAEVIASFVHLHVRNDEGSRSLDVDSYRKAMYDCGNGPWWSRPSQLRKQHLKGRRLKRAQQLGLFSNVAEIERRSGRGLGSIQVANRIFSANSN